MSQSAPVSPAESPSVSHHTQQNNNGPHSSGGDEQRVKLLAVEEVRRLQAKLSETELELQREKAKIR